MPTNLPETAPPCAPKGRGRPAYIPNESHREQVKAMAGYGIPHEHIAKALHLSAPTLRKHYREQLDLSAIEANTNILTSLYRMATTRHNAAAAIFWAKCRCGFRPGGAAYEEAPKAPPPPAPPAPPLRRNSLEGLTAVCNDGAPNGEI